MNLKEKLNNRGITLIALVITIIVLLILAGVSIAMLTGENGILTQAQNAKDETEKAKKNEISDLDSMESLINDYTGDVNIPQVTDEKPGELEQENETTFVINSIEDLVVFSYNVRNGNKYEGQTIKLGVNLDFNSDKSYVDPNRTDYGVYGYEGNLKQLLTTGEGFIPIGETHGADYENNVFYGTFDGSNNIICSLYENVNTNENIRVGLFSTNYGEIKNLGLENVNISVNGLLTAIGGITARSYNNISNCYVDGNIKAEGNSWMPVGGICAVAQEDANIENCYNSADIECKNTKEGRENADIGCGGIVGQGKANINKCYNEGNISIDSGDNPVAIGGICGHLDSGSMKNSYNKAKIYVTGKEVQGERYIGGIVGASYVNGITNCYNYGNLIEDVYGCILGGIIGEQRTNNLVISNVFNNGEIEMQEENIYAIGGIIGVADKGGSCSANVNNAYNTGKIKTEETESLYIGSIVGDNWKDEATICKECYYLKGTYNVGVGGENGLVTGVTELSDISAFPSILEVVNGEGTFKEDVNNINGGYPILSWQ